MLVSPGGGSLAQLGAVTVACVDRGGAARGEEGVGTFLGRSHCHYVRLSGRGEVIIGRKRKTGQFRSAKVEGFQTNYEDEKEER